MEFVSVGLLHVGGSFRLKATYSIVYWRFDGGWEDYHQWLQLLYCAWATGTRGTFGFDFLDVCTLVGMRMAGALSPRIFLS